MKRFLKLLIFVFINFSTVFAKEHVDILCPIGQLMTYRNSLVFNDHFKNIMTAFCKGYKESHAFASGVYPLSLGAKEVKEWLDIVLSGDAPANLRQGLRTLEKLKSWLTTLQCNDKSESSDWNESLEKLKTNMSWFEHRSEDLKSVASVECLIQRLEGEISPLFDEYLMNLRGIFSFSVEACNQIDTCLAKRTLDGKFKFLTSPKQAWAIHDCTHTEPAIIYSNEKGLFWTPRTLEPCMLSRRDACELCLDKLENAVAKAGSSFPKHVVFISEKAYKESFVDYEGEKDLSFREVCPERLHNLCFIRIPSTLPPFGVQEIKIRFNGDGSRTEMLGSDGNPPEDFKLF